MSSEAKKERNEQYCPYLGRECSKPGKSEPHIKVGICSIGYKGSFTDSSRPVIICPFRSDIWRVVPKDKWRKDVHCAVFPEELLKTLILSICPVGGIVPDPFSGTGSNVSAAVKLGRKGIGIDLSEKYTKAAKKRLESLDCQIRLDDLIS